METLIAEPASATGSVEVTMPPSDPAGQVTLRAWLKHPGEYVALDEAVCIVDLGDANAEIGSSAAGVLRMVAVAVGDRLPVGQTLAVIDVRDGALTAGRFAPGQEPGLKHPAAGIHSL